MSFIDEPDRRAVLGGVIAGLACAPGIATAAGSIPTPRLFARTALGNNIVALGFETADMSLPEIRLAGKHGRVSFASLTGKVRIVTLWAEWCVPCLVEARDFAALQRRFAGPGFEIVAVLTASAENLGYGGALERLKRARVEGLPLLVEPDGGRRLMVSLSPDPSGRGGSLPCTLIVDAHGHIRGRSHGAPSAHAPGLAGKTTVPRMLTDADKRAMLAGDQGTLWRSPAGDALVSALRDGILDRIQS